MEELKRKLEEILENLGAAEEDREAMHRALDSYSEQLPVVENQQQEPENFDALVTPILSALDSRLSEAQAEQKRQVEELSATFSTMFESVTARLTALEEAFTTAKEAQEVNKEDAVPVVADNSEERSIELQAVSEAVTQIQRTLQTLVDNTPVRRGLNTNDSDRETGERSVDDLIDDMLTQIKDPGERLRARVKIISGEWSPEEVARRFHIKFEE